MAFDSIVAGAGLWGCTVARRLAEAGKKVLVLEKRCAVGGNCRCETVDGIEVHLYGSHIFHTSNEEVWTFVNRFSKFNDYRHCVLAKTKVTGRNNGLSGLSTDEKGCCLYHLPIGKTLLEEFFGVPMADRNLKEFLAISQTSQTSQTYGKVIFDAFIRGYTSKQWGVPPENVDPSVISRLKVRDNYSTDYFDDPHQGIPVAGYNALFAALLDHTNIHVETEVTLRMAGNRFQASRNSDSRQPSLEIDFDAKRSSRSTVYYSGPLDALLNYKFGHLPWRTLRFETEHLSQDDYQGTTVVNYPDVDVPFTRIHEFKHYHPERSGAFASPRGTVIMREYSAAWHLGDEQYYPVSTTDSAALLSKYQSEAAKIANLVVGGRLGGYKYYDMDKSIATALELNI